jgi:ATP-binding cassette subfamily B protein
MTERDEASPRHKRLTTIYRSFGRDYRRYWKRLALALASLFASVATAALAPWPLKLVLDYVIVARPLPEPFAFLAPLLEGTPNLLLIVLAASVLAITFLASMFAYVGKFLVSSTGLRLIADIRERVFAQLQRLSLSFHESARAGNVVYLLSADAKEMKTLLVEIPQDFAQHVLVFATCAVFMALLDWRLTLIAFAFAPVLFLVTRRFGRSVKEATSLRREREGAVASIVLENVASMAVVQAYGQEEAERGRLARESRKSLDAQLRALRLKKTYSRASDLMTTLGTAAVLYVGGRLALDGDILPGTLVVFVAYLRDISNSVEKVSALFLELTKARVSAERLLELIENDLVMQDDPGAVEAPRFAGRIEFRGVSFAYRAGEPVLNDVSFVVQPGETVALVGESGAGKSTLISLLLRFYDPQAGQVLIDGQDIRDVTLKSLRSQITILLQDAQLFCQSVRDNIAFGKPGASEVDVVLAAERAQAHDFIRQMPDGYDTVIAEGGESLSGGQKQRINIARAIIRDTPIVILDEPGRSLDTVAEARVNAAIRELTRRRTTFIVAHELSTVAAADRILVLDGGRIVHAGTHPELMAASALYRELYELQSNRRTDGALVDVGPEAGRAVSGA